LLTHFIIKLTFYCSYFFSAQTLGQLTDDELTIGSYHDTASISSDPQTQESICSVHSVEVIEDPFGKDNEKEVGIIVDLDKGKDEEWRPQKRQRIDQGERKGLSEAMA